MNFSCERSKILLISRGIPTKQYPLLGIFEFDQAEALVKGGYDVYFFGIDLRSIRRKRKWGISSGIKNGVKWYSISVPLGKAPLGVSCHIGVWALKYLYNYVFGNNKKPNIIHAHFFQMGYIASKLSKEKRIPLVITEHSSKINQRQIDTVIKKYASVGYFAASRVIAVSEALKENIYLNFKIESTVIPNIVSLNDFYLAPKAHEGFGFICTANLVPLKCHRLLIEAFADVVNIHKDTFLGIIGDGKIKNELKELVNKLGIDDKVIFYGQIPRKCIAKLYQEYDCFVLASSSETFGVAYIEAMASGLPVIATRCGGPEDFVSDQTGVLINPENIKELKQSMLFMYNNKDRYDKYFISQYAANKFSDARVSKDIHSVYQGINEGK